MTRRQLQSISSSSGSTYTADAESARVTGSPLGTPQRDVRHPLGPPHRSTTSGRRSDPLLSDLDNDAGQDDEQQFVFVNGQLFPKPATPTDAPPPYAPYPTGRARAQTFTAGSPLVALPPLPQYRRESEPRSTETTPLLGVDSPRRVGYSSPLGFIIKGDERGYWSTLWDVSAWKSLFHTVAINFPFVSLPLARSPLMCPQNLALWPLLLAGTIVGTALLVTLPLGAVFWFATLLLARAGAALETRLQVYFHGAEVRPPRPIFYRQRVREDGQLVWDRRFLSCSWGMVCRLLSLRNS